MKQLKRHWSLLTIYIIFFFSLGVYSYHKILFSNVESWPTVPALNIKEEGHLGSIRSDRYSGTSQRSTFRYSITFDYIVQGTHYRGNRATPDNDPLPQYYEISNKDIKLEQNADDSFSVSIKPPIWRVHYNPNHPSIAVLAPIPYKGIAHIGTMSFTGIFIAVHLFFPIKKLVSNITSSNSDTSFT